MEKKIIRNSLIIGTVLVVVIAGLVVLNVQRKKRPTKEAIVKAREYYIDGMNYFTTAVATDDEEKYNKAIKNIERAIKTNPAYAEAYLSLGMVYSNKEMYDKAEDIWKKAVKINPDLSKQVASLKRSNEIIRSMPSEERRELKEFVKKEYAKAPTEVTIPVEEKSLKAREDYTDGILYMSDAVINEDISKYDEAIKKFKQAIELEPTFEEAYISLGNVYLYKGMSSEAEIMWKKAVELNPNSIEAHVALGKYYADQRMLGKATEECNKVLSLDPNNEWALKYFKEISK